MMQKQNGYVFIEILVSLAVFSALALTVAHVARDAVNPVRRAKMSDMEVILQRLQQNSDQALREYDLQQIDQRTLPNGDRWVTYRYRSEDGFVSRKLSVLRPAKEDAR